MTCEKCMHWREDEFYDQGEDYRICDLISDSFHAKSPMAFTFANYHLITRRDFGCKLFEAKETPR